MVMWCRAEPLQNLCRWTAQILPFMKGELRHNKREEFSFDFQRVKVIYGLEKDIQMRRMRIWGGDLRRERTLRTAYHARQLSRLPHDSESGGWWGHRRRSAVIPFWDRPSLFALWQRPHPNLGWPHLSEMRWNNGWYRGKGVLDISNNHMDSSL